MTLKNTKLKYSVMALVLSLSVISCTYKKDELPMISGCNSTSATFGMDISPIIQTNCAINNAACHGPNSANGPGELTAYMLISGSASVIKSAVVTREMPLGATLSASDIQKIMCWVDAGALNN